MIKERILYYLENKGISKYKFYKKTELSNGFLDNKSSISTDNYEKIIYAYPDINPEWLLTGKGEMLKSEQKSEQEFSSIEEIIEALLSHTLTKKDAIDALKKMLK